MAALVPDYGGSSDSDSNDCTPCTDATKDVDVEIRSETSSRNFFKESAVDVSDSSDSSQGSDCDDLSSAPAQPKLALPSPDMAFKSSGNVFNTQYSLQERAKESILQQHVKMTAKKIPTTKAVCFKFKKGKCNKGNSCRFLHEAVFTKPVTLAKEAGDDAPEEEKDHAPVAPAGSKRPGITNNLQPAKKAKGALNAQRSAERPWTANS